LVETALAMSAFLLLLLGMIDVSRALYTYHMIDNAARLGTRFAIVRGATCAHTATPDPWPCPTPTDGSDIQSYVRQQMLLLGPGTASVSTAWGNPSTGLANPGCTGTSPYNSPGCLVTVTVTYSFHFITPVLAFFPISMTSSSQMVIAQ
jgi:hypothetical protein